MSVRPATPGELPRLFGWASAEPVAWVDDSRLHRELNTRNYRPEWCWTAELDGALVGRALWWGPADAELPVSLDCLLVRDTAVAPEDIGAALIEVGLETFGSSQVLEFNVDVATDWADDPAAVHAIEWRGRAARAGGFARTTERVTFARESSDPRPERSSRLQFAPAADEEFRAHFARVAEGSLDAHTLDMVAREGVEALADNDLKFYLSLPGERSAWRIATWTDQSIGFIIPTRTAYDASISYLGVLPEYRGRGYVNDLLAEMVHTHHDSGEARIVGTTDATNTPMRGAFERAGFAATRRRIVHAK
ncbi:ribosomal protein S18 acetylase RimI-like enzyme [Leifsonia sp. AK011]|uniref:GNAT family N-acetyltransferase n=1 Tax=Leifsonia sp. AK011 TaxID=2723075 RepID=UPI0015CB7B1D|nr:GNAT family N-acetyltransferase [Leifsonia sp. AK011]NYF11241.1 ribosomal protein S18 acetylase RimI-like enzyme [Leifsonia sp. AK011]